MLATYEPFTDWRAALHDSDLSGTIIERVLECGRIVALRGPSMRTRYLEGIDYERCRFDPPSSPKC